MLLLTEKWEGCGVDLPDGMARPRAVALRGFWRCQTLAPRALDVSDALRLLRVLRPSLPRQESCSGGCGYCFAVRCARGRRRGGLLFAFVRLRRCLVGRRGAVFARLLEVTTCLCITRPKSRRACVVNIRRFSGPGAASGCACFSINSRSRFCFVCALSKRLLIWLSSVQRRTYFRSAPVQLCYGTLERIAALDGTFLSTT